MTNPFSLTEEPKPARRKSPKQRVNAEGPTPPVKALIFFMQTSVVGLICAACLWAATWLATDIIEMVSSL